MIKAAILDLNEGHANQGMRCIREILSNWREQHGVELEWDEFEVRLKKEVPDLSYDIYISSGGPGSPLESQGADWELAYFNWISEVEAWNADPANSNKKYVFFICHSFQMACRHYGVGTVSKRKSTSFGVFPVHVTWEGQHDEVFSGLRDPFYVVDSRDWQVTIPNFDKLSAIGADIICIEKFRPHVQLDQAIMAIRFSPYIIGTQFHPEADPIGMSMHLQTEERKKNVIENFGEAKWASMLEHLNDPDKIRWTNSHILPNFLMIAHRHIQQLLIRA